MIKAPRKEDVDKTRRKLEQCRSLVMHAYVVEIRGELASISSGIGRLESSEQTKEERKLLQKLVRPKNCLHYGKQGCLEGTRAAVLGDILVWAFDGMTGSKMLWLYGVAGV